MSNPTHLSGVPQPSPRFTLTTPSSTANALELSPRRCYFLQSGPHYHCEGGSKGTFVLAFFAGCQYCKSLQSICALPGAHSLTKSTYSGCVTHHRCYYLRIPCAPIPTGPGIPSHPRCCSLASPRTGPPPSEPVWQGPRLPLSPILLLAPPPKSVTPPTFSFEFRPVNLVHQRDESGASR